MQQPRRKCQPASLVKTLRWLSVRADADGNPCSPSLPAATPPPPSSYCCAPSRPSRPSRPGLAYCAARLRCSVQPSHCWPSRPASPCTQALWPSLICVRFQQCRGARGQGWGGGERTHRDRRRRPPLGLGVSPRAPQWIPLHSQLRGGEICCPPKRRPHGIPGQGPTDNGLVALAVMAESTLLAPHPDYFPFPGEQWRGLFVFFYARCTPPAAWRHHSSVPAGGPRVGLDPRAPYIRGPGPALARFGAVFRIWLRRAGGRKGSAGPRAVPTPGPRRAHAGPTPAREGRRPIIFIIWPVLRLCSSALG